MWSAGPSPRCISIGEPKTPATPKRQSRSPPTDPDSSPPFANSAGKSCSRRRNHLLASPTRRQRPPPGPNCANLRPRSGSCSTNTRQYVVRPATESSSRSERQQPPAQPENSSRCFSHHQQSIVSTLQSHPNQFTPRESRNARKSGVLLGERQMNATIRTLAPRPIPSPPSTDANQPEKALQKRRFTPTDQPSTTLVHCFTTRRQRLGHRRLGRGLSSR